MFPAIFATQYDELWPFSSPSFLCLKSRPCQKSPSQKTRTRDLVKTMSGTPAKLETLSFGLNPSFRTSRSSTVSHLVAVLALVARARRLARAEAGLRPVYLAVATALVGLVEEVVKIAQRYIEWIVPYLT